MKKLFILTFFGLMASVSTFALDPILGTLSTCVGSTVFLFDSSAAAGTWSSSNSSIASVASPGSGLIYGVSAGVATITYSDGVSFVTANVTVNPAPAAIVGSGSVCSGSTITLSDATSGGVWSSLATSIATVGAATGVVGGVSTGTTTIRYTLPTGCSASKTVSVNTSTIGLISGDSMVCAGSTATLMDGVAGGVWTSGSPSVATIDASTGVVSGVSSGVSTITYTVSGICGSVSTYVDVFVSAAPSAGSITGSSTVSVGSTITLTDAAGGGAWSSSSTATATVNAATGVVTGVATGTVTITYTVTTGCGTATATKTITVSPAAPVNRISGHINFGGPALDSSTLIRIYLITYNPSTHLLEATDSTYTYGITSSMYYQFLGKPTDSYRVKAAIFPAVVLPTDYIPTYHTSSNYWGTADVLYHTGGTDDGVDINMSWGAVTGGPGFIGGDVTTGANKGTSGTYPAVGLLMYVKSSTGTIIQHTTTDAAGHYNFTNLPVGQTYTIYPEAINFATTPYSSISLTASNPGMTNASFGQHTVSKTITPITTGVINISTTASSVITYPNPTNGSLNILWNELATENGTVSVADVTGREVFKTAINMTVGSGVKQIDLSNLTNGIYIITVKSGTINYDNKVQVQH